MSAGPSLDPLADESVTPLVRKTAAWAWRLLIILAAVVALGWLILRLEILFVPVALATIVAALPRSRRFISPSPPRSVTMLGVRVTS